MQTIWPSLTPSERAEIRQMGIERSRTVAEAAGGFLGLGAISSKEKAVIDDLAALLAG